MARVPYLDVQDLAPENRDLLARPINLNRAHVNSPNCRRAAAPMGTYIRYGSTLDPRLREMAILIVGYLASAPYEWSHHIKIGHDFGVSDDDVRAVIAVAEGRPVQLDEKTATVLAVAREMTLYLAIADATFARLKPLFSTEHLVDLVYAIAQYNGVVRFLGALQIDVEPEYETYLAQFPLPKKALAAAVNGAAPAGRH